MSYFVCGVLLASVVWMFLLLVKALARIVQFMRVKGML